jgi:hypothetical protein
MGQRHKRYGREATFLRGEIRDASAEKPFGMPGRLPLRVILLWLRL